MNNPFKSQRTLVPNISRKSGSQSKTNQKQTDLVMKSEMEHHRNAYQNSQQQHYEGKINLTNQQNHNEGQKLINFPKKDEGIKENQKIFSLNKNIDPININRSSYSHNNDYSKNNADWGNNDRNSPPNFHRVNNCQMSPIVEISQHRIEDEQLLDIRAIDADLSKLLASSKNQEQICKMIGIQRPEVHNMKDKKDNHSLPHQIARQFSEPSSHFIPTQIVSQAEILQPIRQRNQSNLTTQINFHQQHKNEEDNIPVFNYREDSKEIPTSKKIQCDLSNKQEQRSYLDRNNHLEPQVYTYFLQQANKGEDIQTMINNQMKNFSYEGKYRIFLTIGEKVKTLKYQVRLL